MQLTLLKLLSQPTVSRLPFIIILFALSSFSHFSKASFTYLREAEKTFFVTFDDLNFFLLKYFSFKIIVIE
jgi:hypothetical protein